MKLRSLELEQFRKFADPVRLSDFEDGLNVLCGPNEFGKSTILAAIRGLLFERHNSRAEPIKRMQPWGGNAAPRLAMTFETGGAYWRIEKRFLHQPMACLTGPNGTRFDGDAAEEQLQQLLGFGPAGRRRSGAEQMGIWGALWVKQRDSVLQADLSSDVARATITGCLDAEVGVIAGGEKGQALIRHVREQLGQLVDGNGKPKGRYKQVLGTITEVDAKLRDLRDRAKRLSADAESLQHRMVSLARENDAAADKRDQDALADARHRKEAALLYQQRLEATKAELALAVRTWEDAERERGGRVARAEAISQSEVAVAQAGEAARIARETAAAAEGEVNGRRVAESEARARATEASRVARRAREVLELVRGAVRLMDLERAAGQAALVEDRVNGLTARLESMRITAEGITAFRKLGRDRDTAQAVLEAQATQIDFDLLDAGRGRVEVAGAALVSGRETVSAVEDTEIRIDGIGRIRVRPAIGDRNKLLQRLEAAEDNFRAALADASAGDLAEAEQLWTEREGLERALADARAELARLTPGDKELKLAPGIGPLRERIDIQRRRLADARAALGLDAFPELEQAAADIRDADDAELAASEALSQARAVLDSASSRYGVARESLIRAEKDASAAQTERDRLAGEAKNAEAREPAAMLDLRVGKAEAKRATLSAELAELERTRPLDTPELMQARIERYDRALEGRRRTIRQLREEIAGLRARIAQEGGHGLDELIAEAERENDALLQERDYWLREIRILNFLLDTLSAAEREAKERYLAPVVRRVTPYLRTLFPGAEVACDDTLRITGITRGHFGPEEFDRLSDGTQEQLAVLARLAFAEILIDQGKPAMIILDDALAYSDADRMERMFDVLTQAAAKSQILVLSCREDLFARLGANRIELAPVQAARSTLC